MNPPYYLFESSLLILPLLGVLLSKYIVIEKHLRVIKFIVLFFLIHNTLYFIGYSVKGDYFDYIIFAIEYPFLLVLLIGFRKIWRNIYTLISRMIGYVVFAFGYLSGLVGVIVFIVGSSDYEPYKIFNYGNIKTYETRCYSFGFATVDATTYTFDTYRTFKYLPVEELLDRSKFYNIDVNWNIGEDLTFKVNQTNGADSLIIISKNRVVYTKKIK